MKYQRKSEIVSAVQWFKMGDHKDVKRYSNDKKLCSSCGNPYREHGIIGIYLVCPSGWVVAAKDGIRVMSDEEFREKYEPWDSPYKNVQNKYNREKSKYRVAE
jgi:hypothetical protein